MVLASDNLPAGLLGATKMDCVIYCIIYLAVSYESYIILYAVDIELCTIKTDNFYTTNKVVSKDNNNDPSREN